MKHKEKKKFLKYLGEKLEEKEKTYGDKGQKISYLWVVIDYKLHNSGKLKLFHIMSVYKNKFVSRHILTLGSMF